MSEAREPDVELSGTLQGESEVGVCHAVACNRRGTPGRATIIILPTYYLKVNKDLNLILLMSPKRNENIPLC